MAQKFCCKGAEQHLQLHEGGANFPCEWCETHSERLRPFGGCEPDD